MATHRSALKRHRQSLKRRLRNVSCKSSIKTAIKRVNEALSKGDKEEAELLLKRATSLLDRAVSKGVLHRNNASRRISRLVSRVNSGLSR